MPHLIARFRAALLWVLAAVVLGLWSAGPAAADHDDSVNPDVGGSALHGDGLVIDGAADPIPAPGAASFLIADLDTGEVLAAQNAHVPAPPASTLKMLTALTVLPRVDLDEVYTATDLDVNVEGSKVGIVPGSTYTARQLFEALFLVSGNDAATAVARLNGDLDSALDAMQAEAWRVQAYDTVVRNASGLDAPGQLTTAYDLALIARAGMARDDFAGFAGLASSTFPLAGAEDPLQRPSFEIWTQNDLVNGGYDGAIGVKSGFTTQAGRTFAAAAERDGKRYLVTLMGIEGNTYRTGGAFLDWAFANADGLEPVGELAEPKYGISQSDEASVVSGDGPRPAAAGSLVAAGPGAAAGSGGGRVPLFLAGAVAVSSALIWLGLRRQHRRAWRQRGPVGPVPAAAELIDLRQGQRV